MIKFITGNKNKFEEVKAVLSDVEQMNIDIPEIQDVDAKEIVRQKLLFALDHQNGELIVEDTGLYMDCLNGLPGPFIKWFLLTIKKQGLVDLTEKLGNKKAFAKTIIGYAKNRESINFFEGVIKGRIVEPQGESNFGWDSIFMPEGYDKTFAEMGRDEKNKISMRRIALNKLSEFLSKK